MGTSRVTLPAEVATAVLVASLGLACSGRVQVGVEQVAPPAGDEPTTNELGDDREDGAVDLAVVDEQGQNVETDGNDAEVDEVDGQNEDDQDEDELDGPDEEDLQEDELDDDLDPPGSELEPAQSG